MMKRACDGFGDVSLVAAIALGVTFDVARVSGQNSDLAFRLHRPWKQSISHASPRESSISPRIRTTKTWPSPAHGLGAEVGLLDDYARTRRSECSRHRSDGPLGVIRTTELLAAGSHYGVQQFFTRAVDTGFSKSPEWTMKIWGDQLPMEDMVRVIRTYRPQVVINGWGGTHNGHGQHQSSGLLTPQAIAQAADPTKFPDQIREGLLAWKVPLELRPANSGFGPAVSGGAAVLKVPGRGGAVAGGRGAGVQLALLEEDAEVLGEAEMEAEEVEATPVPGVRMATADISPLWGISYVEMGAEGRSNHVSQGTPMVFGAGFGRRNSSLAVEKGDEAAGLFDPMLLINQLLRWLHASPACSL